MFTNEDMEKINPSSDGSSDDFTISNMEKVYFNGLSTTGSLDVDAASMFDDGLSLSESSSHAIFQLQENENFRDKEAMLFASENRKNLSINNEQDLVVAIAWVLPCETRL